MPSSVIRTSFWLIRVAVSSSWPPKSPRSVSSGRSRAHRTAPTRRLVLQLRERIRVFLVLVYRIYLLPLLLLLHRFCPCCSASVETALRSEAQNSRFTARSPLRGARRSFSSQITEMGWLFMSVLRGKAMWKGVLKGNAWWIARDGARTHDGECREEEKGKTVDFSVNRPKSLQFLVL